MAPACKLEYRPFTMEQQQKKAAAAALNATIVRPASFYLTGFIDIPHVRYYYIFLCLVYIVTVVGNGLLLIIIYLTKSLHTAKYMIVAYLALMDLCGSTALIPKLLDSFLFDRRSILYEACLSYMFFVQFFLSMQSWTLVIMSFDRFVAICFPLYYHSVVTESVVATMLVSASLALLALVASAAGLLNRLSFCRSVAVKSFYCDHGPLYRLACNDTSWNNILANIGIILVLVIPLVLIALSYLCICVALGRIASGVERLRAMKTCTSHLILVAIFFLPIISTNIAFLFSYIHPNTRIINSSLTQILPALLNPIVYSLKTDEVLQSFRVLFLRNQIFRVSIK